MEKEFIEYDYVAELIEGQEIETIFPEIEEEKSEYDHESYILTAIAQNKVKIFGGEITHRCYVYAYKTSEMTTYLMGKISCFERVDDLQNDITYFINYDIHDRLIIDIDTIKYALEDGCDEEIEEVMSVFDFSYLSEFINKGDKNGEI